MTEWNCQVVRIENVVKHPDADALSIATVLGNYPVIIKLDQYKQGDLATYIAIDSMVDISKPEFSFLERPRIRARKLRGIYSQGLLVDAPEGFKEGDSVLDHFGLKKYVYPEEVEDLIGLPEEEKKYYHFPKIDQTFIAKVRGRNAAPPPKGWAALYYDLDSVRKYGHVFKEGEEVICCEKLDGSNLFARHDGEQLFIKSRNFYKKRPDKEGIDSWWDIAFKYNLEEVLKAIPDYGIYGELIGSVSPFFYDCGLVNGKVENKLKVFDIYDFKNNCFLDFDDMVKCATDLNLELAPVIYRGPWSKELYSLIEKDSDIVRKLPQATPIMEGMVVRPVKERTVPHVGRCILKLKSERYLLFKK